MKKYLTLTSILTVTLLSVSPQQASASFFGNIFDGLKNAGKTVGETALDTGKTVAGGVAQIGKDAYADRFKWAGVVVNGAAVIGGSVAYGAAAGAAGGGGMTGPHLSVKPIN